MNHKVICHGLPIVFHLRAKDPLAHKVDRANHKQCHDNSNDGANCVGGLRGRLLSGITAKLVRVVSAVYVVVTLLVFSDTNTIGAAELVRSTSNFTLVLIRAILAVTLSIAAECKVNTLAAVALELTGRAHRAVVLITIVITLWVAIAAPSLRNAVHLP